jgi:hypothetical protein
MAGYRSALEGRVADLLEHHRVNYEYETVQLPYVLECKYKPDFILPNGIYLEVKGYLDADDKRKMVAVKKAHPELDIRFVFQGPFKLIPRTKMTHAQWAEHSTVMAKVSFNYYDDDGSRISHQLRGEQVHRPDDQIDRFIEFLLGQGFREEDIFHHLDTLVNEYDDDNPGKLDGEFGF